MLLLIILVLFLGGSSGGRLALNIINVVILATAALAGANAPATCEFMRFVQSDEAREVVKAARGISAAASVPSPNKTLVR